MLTGIFDSHAHYDDEQFAPDREELLAALPERGVALVMNCACDLASCETSVGLAERYGYFYCAVGIHPHSAAEARPGYLDTLRGYVAKHPKVRAIGEIGLDYHYDFSPRDVQKRVFEEQILLAKELDLPVIVHDREAHQDTMELLEKHRPRGVMHCYSGSAEMARELVKLGFYLGFGGSCTFKNARKALESLQAVPAERILLETDAPYLAPVPMRGRRNDSPLIPYAAQVAAGEKGMDPQALVDQARANACRLFGICRD